MQNFESLELAEPLARALSDLGHSTPTPIQAQAIPPAMERRDVMGIAQTGTGKTAGFSLPTLHHIFTENREPPKRGARVLILAPTRELASQIGESVRSYGRHMMQLSVAVIFGGVPIARQIKRLTGGNDVLVATPGRLIDLLDRKAIKLDGVEILILDEADQMLDMGFIHALKKIVPALPKERQTLFFSATLAPKIKQLSKQFLNDPVHVSVTPANRTADKVTQRMFHVSRTDKQNRLAVELLQPDVGRSLVFTRTKHGADRVVKRLAKVGIAAVAIHGNKSQAQRTRALEAFRSGKVETLVATDIAARGIDVPEITHVFNFELPNVPEQYVHRIGRTARAQRAGLAISFVATEKDTDEADYLRAIEKLLKTKIPQGETPSDLAEQLKALNTRKPLPKPEPPKQDTRSGRGKSRKKRGRFSKDKARKETELQREGSITTLSKTASAGNTPSRKGRSRRAPHRQDGGRVSEERKPQSTQQGKPKMSGNPSGETRSRKTKRHPARNHEAASQKSESRQPTPKPSAGRGSGGDGAPKRRRQRRRPNNSNKRSNKPPS